MIRKYKRISEQSSVEVVSDNDLTTVREVFQQLISNPRIQLLHRWNWKSASLSSLSRAFVFFMANLGAGTRAAVGAMTLEFVYRSITSGFYGAITQSFRKAEPVWAATITVMFCVPAVTHLIEFAVHLIGGTQRLAISIGASVCFSVLSTAFNLFAMRRGILIVGAGRESLLHDLRRLPALIAEFVASPVLKPLRRSSLSRAASIPESQQEESGESEHSTA